MGYNLYLYCRTCDEVAFAFRGKEAVAIGQFVARHPSGHQREVAIDNGFTDAPDWDREADLGLPDDSP